MLVGPFYFYLFIFYFTSLSLSLFYPYLIPIRYLYSPASLAARVFSLPFFLGTGFGENRCTACKKEGQVVARFPWFPTRTERQVGILQQVKFHELIQTLVVIVIRRKQYKKKASYYELYECHNIFYIVYCE